MCNDLLLGLSWLGSPRLFESIEYDLTELGESVPLMSGESSLGFLDIVALCVVAQLLHNYSILPLIGHADTKSPIKVTIRLTRSEQLGLPLSSAESPK